MTEKKKYFRVRTTPADYLSTREVANILGVTVVSVRRYISEYGLPAIKPAGRWIVPREAFDQWLNKQRNVYEDTTDNSN